MDVLADLVARISVDVADLKKGLSEAEKSITSFSKESQNNFAKTQTSVNDLSQTWSGFGLAIRTIIPSMSEMKILMDGNATAADKFSMALSGVGQGLSTLIVRSNMSQGAMAGTIAALNVGLALVSKGLDAQEQVNITNEVGAKLNEALTDSNWVQANSSRALAESYIKQAEATMRMNDEGNKFWLAFGTIGAAVYAKENASIQERNKLTTDFIDLLRSQIKAYDDNKKAAEASVKAVDQWRTLVTALTKFKSALGIVTAEEMEQTKYILGIQQYMQDTGASYSEAVAYAEKLKQEADILKQINKDEAQRLVVLKDQNKALMETFMMQQRMKSGAFAQEVVAGGGGGFGTINEGLMTLAGIPAETIRALLNAGGGGGAALRWLTSLSTDTTGQNKALNYLNQMGGAQGLLDYWNRVYYQQSHVEAMEAAGATVPPIVIKIDGKTVAETQSKPLGDMVNKSQQVGK